MIVLVALFSTFYTLIASEAFLPTDDCPILGPTFPSDFDITATSAFQDATAIFPSLIDSLFSSGAVNKDNTTFTIDVFSAATNNSIYSYRHEGPGQNGTLTTGILDENTIFRTGSVSKLMTTYALLVYTGGLGVFDHPVTTYLPELAGNAQADPLQNIVWEDITIGALASQMGGTGSFRKLVTCKCSVNDFHLVYFEALRSTKRPVFAPFATSLYSDSGFGILGRILERMTGLSYNDAIQKILSEPLGLNSLTSFAPSGEDLNAFVFPGNKSVSPWANDNQIFAPYLTHRSGGIYTSNADLRTVGLAMLHSSLLPKTTTREWMKPRAHTATLAFSNGAPWEIYRLALPVSPGSTRTRISDLYTKAGGNGVYSAIFALSPDHGIGFSILLGGQGATHDRWPLRNLVGETFVTAAEHAAVERGTETMTGTFVSETLDETNLTLTTDADKPGLGLKEWFIGGVESRANIIQPGAEIPTENLTVRLYPTGLRSQGSGCNAASGSGTELLSFRAIPQVTPVTGRAAAEGGEGMFDGACMGWLSVDFFTTDDFVLQFVNGRVKKVFHPFFQIWMTRVE
ncbi:beta-lactamase/transpeptidase-like protein [Polychaeton citri CBS 116435]|uniref:Beta-lactamase/transpeptidase-like protein n=1 Tax=Polychaeton citri CBS 116435 TaxID=1314669 RepID=A0A9P4PYN3_9PEZI|nr:beta-lactamase/transpeptidase-like protein [Polychaeton citri CBS 116435]